MDTPSQEQRVKSSVSRGYCGKENRYRILNFNFNAGGCFIVRKKYAIVAAYISVAVALLVVVYNAVWIPNLNLWHNNGASSNNVKAVDNFLLIGDHERASFDQLMHYILHPQTPCLTSMILGGRRLRNGKLDGDKVVCLEPGPGINEECIVYSFGIANEWSFDEGIHNKFGCNVYSFDPSMGYEHHLHSKGIWFYNLGIGEFDGNITVGGHLWNMRTFSSILQMLGHMNKTIDVLKMDIEGAEFVALEDMLEKGLLNHVNQLCIEIHLPTKPSWTRVLKLLKRIEAEAGLRLFSTRNNTQVPLWQVPGFHSRYEQRLFEMAWYRH